MNLFNLKDNPIFLQNWRERTRPSHLLSAIVLTIFVIIMIVTNASVNTEYIYNNAHSWKAKKALSPLDNTFFDLCVFQGYILLLFGTIQAYRMAARERISGTLDFHRSSPTSRKVQVIGLLLGSTSLEWLMYLGIAALQCGIVIASQNLHFSMFIQFQIALIMCGIFYCTIAILTAIALNMRVNRLSAVPVVIVLYVFLTMIVANKHSFLHHLTWLPAFEQLKEAFVDDGYTFRTYSFYKSKLKYMFFGYKVHSLLFQTLIQVPLIGLCCVGISRKISQVEHPVFTKGQSLLLIFFVLFLFTGSAVSQMIFPEYYRHYGVKANFTFFVFLVYSFGMFGSITATPSQLNFLKGLRKIKKGKVEKITPGDDQSHNTAWLITFCFIAALIFAFYIYFLKRPIHHGLCAIVVVCAYTVFFAKFWEYFRFSKHHRKISYIVTFYIILWGLLPILATILRKAFPSRFIQHIFVAPSPLFGGLEPVVKVMTSQHMHSSNFAPGKMMVSLIVSIALATIAIFLANRERKRLIQEVSKEGSS